MSTQGEVIHESSQHPDTGMIAYWLPLQAGTPKNWGTPTEDFWCCHGTLVEAHTVNERSFYFEDDVGLVVSQYIPSDLLWRHDGVAIRVTLTANSQLGEAARPHSLAYDLQISCERSVDFALQLRLPWWLAGEPTITVNGTPETGSIWPSRLHSIKRTWHDDRVALVFPKALTSEPLPDRTDVVAFMDGPVVLGGVSDNEQCLRPLPALPGVGSMMLRGRISRFRKAVGTGGRTLTWYMSSYAVSWRTAHPLSTLLRRPTGRFPVSAHTNRPCAMVRASIFHALIRGTSHFG